MLMRPLQTFTTGKSIESIIVKNRRAWLASALSVVVFLMLVGSVAADTKATKGNADAQHHNPITPQDRDTRSSRASLAVAVIPFLTTALFTAGRHCDDFML